uniref:Uncharacterized protein n=1 Tax=Timema monikensis TaxID=170555 RepID=A0A7R9E5S2_9NEOP|nr:unnamed protein product [Timema monikensis]
MSSSPSLVYRGLEDTVVTTMVHSGWRIGSSQPWHGHKNNQHAEPRLPTIKHLLKINGTSSDSVFKGECSASALALKENREIPTHPLTSSIDSLKKDVIVPTDAVKESETTSIDSLKKDKIVPTDAIKESETTLKDSLEKDKIVPRDAIKESEPALKDSLEKDKISPTNPVKEIKPALKDSVEKDEIVPRDAVRENEKVSKNALNKDEIVTTDAESLSAADLKKDKTQLLFNRVEIKAEAGINKPKATPNTCLVLSVAKASETVNKNKTAVSVTTNISLPRAGNYTMSPSKNILPAKITPKTVEEKQLRERGPWPADKKSMNKRPEMNSPYAEVGASRNSYKYSHTNKHEAIITHSSNKPYRTEIDSYTSTTNLCQRQQYVSEHCQLNQTSINQRFEDLESIIQLVENEQCPANNNLAGISPISSEYSSDIFYQDASPSNSSNFSDTDKNSSPIMWPYTTPPSQYFNIPYDHISDTIIPLHSARSSSYSSTEPKVLSAHLNSTSTYSSVSPRSNISPTFNAANSLPSSDSYEFSKLAISPQSNVSSIGNISSDNRVCSPNSYISPPPSLSNSSVLSPHLDTHSSPTNSPATGSDSSLNENWDEILERLTTEVKSLPADQNEKLEDIIKELVMESSLRQNILSSLLEQESPEEITKILAAEDCVAITVHDAAPSDTIPKPNSRQGGRKGTVSSHLGVPKCINTTGKCRLMKKMNERVKSHNWITLIHVANMTDDKLAKGDEKHGDTQLMILVANWSKHGKRAYTILYAFVERLKKIQNGLTALNRQGQSALFLACMFANEERIVARYIAESLLEIGENINEVDKSGNTLLHYLCSCGDTHAKVMAELLALKDDNGNPRFNVNQQNLYGETPLHFAAMRKQGETSVATVALLVMNGADITIKRIVDDSTPLHCALGVSCQPLLVKELLKSSDRIVAANQRMKGDRSPLELVARSETHLLQCQGSVFKMLAEYTEKEDVDQALSTMEDIQEGREYYLYTGSIIDTPRWTGLSAPWRDYISLVLQTPWRQLVDEDVKAERQRNNFQ